MRDYDAIFEDAKEGSPFSNGTAGEIWMDQWCYRCKVDGPFQRDEAPEGCPLLLVALMQRTPKEWTEVGCQDYTCSEFVPDDEDDDGGEPTPEPGPPPAEEIDGQVDMFAVFADQITEQAEQRTGVMA